MSTDHPMQLGMIGLGRMGANLVRRRREEAGLVGVGLLAPVRQGDDGAEPGTPRLDRDDVDSCRSRSAGLRPRAVHVRPGRSPRAGAAPED